MSLYRSILVACDIINALAADFRPQSCPTIIARLNRDYAQHLHHTTVWRILKTLEQTGFAEQAERGLWRLSPSLTKIADSLRQHLHDEAQRLADMHDRFLLKAFPESSEPATAKHQPSNGKDE